MFPATSGNKRFVLPGMGVQVLALNFSFSTRLLRAAPNVNFTGCLCSPTSDRETHYIVKEVSKGADVNRVHCLLQFLLAAI